MSFQFDPSRHVGYVSRSLQEASLTCHTSFCGNPQAQQSLHMGSSSPFLGQYYSRDFSPTGIILPRQVSFSPMPTIPTHNLPSRRIMYPLPTYTYGNPGYYYDPLHHPHTMGTQTTGSLYSTHDVPQTPTYMYPTNFQPNIPNTLFW